MGGPELPCAWLQAHAPKRLASFHASVDRRSRASFTRPTLLAASSAHACAVHVQVIVDVGRHIHIPLERCHGANYHPEKARRNGSIIMDSTLHT